MKRSGDRPSGPKPLAGSAARRVEAIVEAAEQAAGKVIDDAERQAREYVAEAQADADRAVAERLTAVGELADALLDRAEEIRRQAELLAESLRTAKGQLGTAGSDPEAAGDDRSPAAAEAEGTAPADDAADEEPEGGERRATGSVGASWRLGPAPEGRGTGSAQPSVPGSGPELAPAPAPAPRAPHLTPVDSAQPVADGIPGLAREIPLGSAGSTPAGARLLATQMAVSGSSREEIAARLRSGFEIEDTDAILDAILGPEG